MKVYTHFLTRLSIDLSFRFLLSYIWNHPNTVNYCNSTIFSYPFMRLISWNWLTLPKHWLSLIFRLWMVFVPQLNLSFFWVWVKMELLTFRIFIIHLWTVFLSTPFLKVNRCWKCLRQNSPMEAKNFMKPSILSYLLRSNRLWIFHRLGWLVGWFSKVTNYFR